MKHLAPPSPRQASRPLSGRALRALLRLVLCLVLFPCAHGAEAAQNGMAERLWYFTGIPQRETARAASEDRIHAPLFPAVRGTESHCYRLQPEPCYFGVLDPSSGYLNLTRYLDWDKHYRRGDSISAAAFSLREGGYLFISQEISGDKYPGSRIRASKPLRALLPADLSLKSFLKPGASPDTGGLALFYLTLELPRYGTDVLAHLEFLPLGLKVEKSDPEFSADDTPLLLASQVDDVSIASPAATSFDGAIPLVATPDGEILLSFNGNPFLDRDEKTAFRQGMSAVEYHYAVRESQNHKLLEKNRTLLARTNGAPSSPCSSAIKPEAFWLTPA